MITSTLHEIIDVVLRNHPPECIFAEGAAERIYAKVTSQQFVSTEILRRG